MANNDNPWEPIEWPFQYKPHWQGPLPGRSFEKQTEDALNALKGAVDDISGAATPSDAAPKAPGTASPGVSDTYSRGDHRHPAQSTISGNAGTATKLQNARTIALSGEAAGSATFDGSTNITIPTTLQVAATGSPTVRTLADRFADIINVRDFGAKGNGIADDADAIQAALTAAPGRTVYFPAGTYKLGHWLKLYSNTILMGEKGTALRRDYATSSVDGVERALLMGAYPIGDESTIHDIEIRNIVFDGNGDNYSSMSFDILAFGCQSAAPDPAIPMYNLVIEECDFLNVVGYHAIDLVISSNVLIRRCQFRGYWLNTNADNYVNNSFATQREAIQWDLGNINDDEYRNRNVIIEQCYFGPPADYDPDNPGNFGAWRVAVGNHGFGERDATTYFDSVVIRNNIFDLVDTNRCAIHLYVFSNVLIEGNVAKHCELAYILNKYVVHSDETTDTYRNLDICIQNNLVEAQELNGSYGDEGILIETYKDDDVPWDESLYQSAAAENITIRGNVFRYCNKGIRSTMAGARGMIISENIFEHCGDVANGGSISMVACVEQVKIINNIFKQSGAVRCVVDSSLAGFADIPGIMTDLLVSGNSWVDPYVSGMTFILDEPDTGTSYLRGLIYTNNIVSDSNTTRNPTRKYVVVAGPIIGGVMRDNYIYTASADTGFYSVSGGGSALIMADNYNYVNNTLTLVTDNTRITNAQIDALF